jgi:DNA-binding MarR family transcriptional regulator
MMRPSERNGAVVSEPAVATAGSAFDLLMWEIGRAYYAYVGVAERLLADAGLSGQIQPGMGLVLFSLYEQDGRTIKEIAARSQLANSTLSGLLARMEKTGLIERTRDEHDRRLVRVRLTAGGRALETKCREMVGQMNGIISAGMGERRMAQAKRLLRLLSETLRASDETPVTRR